MSDTEILERRRMDEAGLESDWVASTAADRYEGIPVIRIPAIPENRTMLKELRARELAVWDAEPGVSPRHPDFSRDDREGQMILLVLAVVALAVGVQAISAALGFVGGWEGFRAWVGVMIDASVTTGA